MNRVFETDEDEMIYHLALHKDTVTWLCDKLSAEGIKFKRTRGNSAEGDILLINHSDEPKVKEMIRSYHRQFNE